MIASIRYKYSIESTEGKVMVSELVIKSKKGDKEAFAQLVEMYYDQMFLLSLSIMKNPYDAYDVCQEGFIKAYRKIWMLRDNDKFKSWLSRIIRNISKDMYIEKKNDPDFEETLEIEGFVNEDTAEKMDIYKYLLKLKDEYREVLVLRYFQDLQIKEIARLTGTPVNTVKSRLRYALSAMKGLMEGYEN